MTTKCGINRPIAEPKEIVLLFAKRKPQSMFLLLIQENEAVTLATLAYPSVRASASMRLNGNCTAANEFLSDTAITGIKHAQ